MDVHLVIDADGHVFEGANLREYLDPRWDRPRLMPQDNFDRTLRGALGQTPSTAEAQIAAMDEDGIDVMVLYGSTALSIGVVREEEFSLAYARAFNSWLADFCKLSPRLQFVALLPPRDPAAAAEELRRAVAELGAVGGMLPNNVPQRPDWGHRTWDPIYAAAAQLDVGIAFHAAMAETIGIQRLGNFIGIHAVGHPTEQMVALTAVVVGGVLERFPTLRVGFLESGIGWVPYIMDRLDEEVEKRGSDEAPWLTMLPSEYIKSGRVFFGVECEEKTLPDGVRWGLEGCLLYSSDYPHWDGDWPHTVRAVRERQDLTDATKRKMLGENAVRFYGPALARAVRSPGSVTVVR